MRRHGLGYCDASAMEAMANLNSLVTPRCNLMNTFTQSVWVKTSSIQDGTSRHGASMAFKAPSENTAPSLLNTIAVPPAESRTKSRALRLARRGAGFVSSWRMTFRHVQVRLR